jgi:hypothetical protein
MAVETFDVKVSETVTFGPPSLLPEAGFAARVKSIAGGAVTIRTAFAECEIVPEVAVIVKG